MRGHYASATFDTKTAARAWATEVEAKIKSGRRADSADQWTVGDMITEYAKQVSPKKRGKRWEQVRAAMMQRDPLALEYLSGVGRREVAAYRDRRLAVVKSSSVNRELNFLSAVFAWAMRELEIIDRNPVHGLQRPTNPPHRVRRISGQEIERMCAALGYTQGTVPESSSGQVALAWLIGIETAMRASEILSLTKVSVNKHGRYASLARTKNGDARRVSLSSEAMRLIELCPGKERMFGISSAVCSTLFTRAVKRAGIDNLHFHDSRHEAATRLARRLDVLDLARMMGVRDLRTLQVYYNPTATEIAERLG